MDGLVVAAKEVVVLLVELTSFDCSELADVMTGATEELVNEEVEAVDIALLPPADGNELLLDDAWSRSLLTSETTAG